MDYVQGHNTAWPGTVVEQRNLKGTLKEFSRSMKYFKEEAKFF